MNAITLVSVVLPGVLLLCGCTTRAGDKETAAEKNAGPVPTLDFTGSRADSAPTPLYLAVNRPEIGLAFKLHCFESGPFRTGTGEKLGDGRVVFTHKGLTEDKDELTCVTTFTPKPGGRVLMEVEADGPLDELKQIRFLDGCMQHWQSPAFKRRGALSEFAERSFIFTMRGPVSLMDTGRGMQKGFPPDSSWNNPAGTQWHVDHQCMHPGDIWAFGTCGDRPVHDLIGTTSRDGKWLTAMGRRYNLSIGQGWHDCLHTGGHTRWYVDEKAGKILQRTMLYVMPNDKEKLLAVYLEDFPAAEGLKEPVPDDQGLRGQRPGSRTGTRLEVEPDGRTLRVRPVEKGAPALEFSLEAADASRKTDAGQWKRTYWGSLFREGGDWRMWAHPVGDAVEVCVSLAESPRKDSSRTVSSIGGTDWVPAEAPDGVSATVRCSKDGQWTAALFWERSETADRTRGIPAISEPGGKSLSVRGRLCVYKGKPNELTEQWNWACADWKGAVPYRMPATDEPVVRPGQTVTFGPDSQMGERVGYGLTIIPPWKDGGTLHVNFPEHLEYDDDDPENVYVGYSILRHQDKIEYPWKISPDGRSAWYDVQSPHLPAVRVEARLTSNGPLATLWVRITNGGDVTLPRINPMLCFQYKGLEGFPQSQDDFKHTYVMMDGKPKLLADMKTEKPETTGKVAYVEGRNQHDLDKFATSRGGLIDQPLQKAVAALTSLDGKRKVVLAFEPSKSILSNRFIPCFHTDPYFGTLEPGQSAEASGAILFTEEGLEEAMGKMAWGEWIRGAGR